MNILKILITSIAFPFLYARETLNAVTIPLLIFSLNWAVGLSLSKQMAEVAAFFKVVVIIRLVIKRLFFLDLDEPHQRVHSS
ncbi:hypothetical protein ABMX65_22800 [Vibrio vulnificus]|uniref:hypothetical protein n=1 Tax=Vibrio vulnificus TaxID=672 RepID=UPI0040583194